MESIQEIIKKIKGLSDTKKGRDILSICLLVIVSGSSFIAGRYSKPENTKQNIVIYGAHNPDGQNLVTKNNVSSDSKSDFTYINTETDKLENESEKKSIKGNYMASSRGKKYYPVDCPASKNIKESNRIYFDRATDAEKRGYTLSSSCE